MASQMLYPINDAEVHRHSTIDQFKNFLSAWKKGGWVPLIFDQLDGIVCETVKTHPVAITFEERPLGYVYPEAECVYFSDKYVYFDKQGVEYRVLPDIFGGNGELFPEYVSKNSFLNFSTDDSLGAHSERRFRVGTSYVTADGTLPAVS